MGNAARSSSAGTAADTRADAHPFIMIHGEGGERRGLSTGPAFICTWVLNITALLPGHSYVARAQACLDIILHVHMGVFPPGHRVESGLLLSAHLANEFGL